MGSVPQPRTATKPANLINLQLGWPSTSLCASSGILEGAQQVLTSADEIRAAFIYGPHQGHPPLRESIAKWLSDVYLYPQRRSIDPNRIAVSNGASANLSNILQKFTDAEYTRRVFMAEPTYFLACPIFEDNGFHGKLRGVPEDSEGLDIEFLRLELERAETQTRGALRLSGNKDEPRFKRGEGYPKVYRYVIYLVPTFSNPSGMTMSLRRREQVVALAREYDALVVTDDVYDVLSWPADPSAVNGQEEVKPSPPPRLVDLDAAMAGGDEAWGNTVSNGSFSKIIGPGVRVGWCECTRRFAMELAEVGSSSSGGAPSHLTSTFVDKMLRNGMIQKHISNTLIPTYRSRYEVLLKSIKVRLVPLGVEISSKIINNVAGGFFIYLNLPSGMPQARIVAAVALQEQNLRVAFGDMFTVAGDETSTVRAKADGGFGKSIRLCWAWHEEVEIQEGVERLARAVESIRDKQMRGEELTDGKGLGIR